MYRLLLSIIQIKYSTCFLGNLFQCWTWKEPLDGHDGPLTLKLLLLPGTFWEQDSEKHCWQVSSEEEAQGATALCGFCRLKWSHTIGTPCISSHKLSECNAPIPLLSTQDLVQLAQLLQPRDSDLPLSLPRSSISHSVNYASSSACFPCPSSPFKG